MWIHLNDAFVSLVKDDKRTGYILARARFPGDLERTFPGFRVREGEGTDYRFRASVPTPIVEQAIAEAVRGITYTNFKDTVREPHRHDAYVRCWAVLRSEQDRRQFAPDGGDALDPTDLGLLDPWDQ